jgi:ethanolamine ammonia-lyase large subunit
MNERDLRQTFVLANEFKEGDLLVGGTRDDRIRDDAQRDLAALSIQTINRTVFVEDQLTEALARATGTQEPTGELTVSEVKRLLLSEGGPSWAQRHREELSSEAIAAVVKIMTNDELSLVARSLFNPLQGSGVQIGSSSHFGSRIQPNSPGDDEEEILFSILEGLSHGCGDVILGLNPASDDVDSIVRLEELLCRVVTRLELPTRYCVLSDIVKQTTARERTKVDVGFQSLAGTSTALRGMVGLDVEGLLDLASGFDGLYFETGQGSAVTNGTAQGIDMVTLEARAYGLARLIGKQTGKWMIVNDVAGFIGPEVFRTGDQLLRACLEDIVMAKLHGLTMGLDVCATFHMGIEPSALRNLTASIAEMAAPAYLMGVAGNADPMLGYLTTSFREHPELRKRTGRRVSSPMGRRLREIGVLNEDGDLKLSGAGPADLYAMYVKASDDNRDFETVRAEGAKTLDQLRQRGYELDYGRDAASESRADERVERIYRHARRSLYATIDKGLIDDLTPKHLRVRTLSRDREVYLSQPASGESISGGDAERVAKLYPTRRPQVQIVISDGLNADAINENLRSVLPSLKQQLSSAGYHTGEVEVFVENGRVRAGYHVGALLDADVVVHLIGERPGTGLNTLSAYLTYGRDSVGQSRWKPGMDHSVSNAVCGINRRGKLPEQATVEIVKLVKRMMEERRSGVVLGGSA